MDLRHFVWTEKYRPDKVSDCILPANLQAQFQSYVNEGNIPNLILGGGAGVGKTTVARAMVKELDCDLLFINGSLDGNIDTLRNDIRNFATTSAFNGKRKYVLLDEADHLNPNSTQPALRSFMEEHARNCGFILTCNYPNKIIEPLHSRGGVVIDMTIGSAEAPKLAARIAKRLGEILQKENVECKAAVINQLVVDLFPDMRKMLITLQRSVRDGHISSNVLSTQADDLVDELWDLIKTKNFKDMRTFVAANKDIQDVYVRIYRRGDRVLKPDSIPNVILIISNYMERASRGVDPEVTLAACATELMSQANFK